MTRVDDSTYPDHDEGTEKSPLDPLSAAEIAVAVATVRAARRTPECMMLLGVDIREASSYHQRLFQMFSLRWMPWKMPNVKVL
ncbi:hypothetical protein E2562_036306 [Oryza meyeriana var. granulata]|uniref:Uncharacterized protein n=1 Tax=Oryza meyeriana var. granulata TaxID=110450 RepID=A0A6G1FGA9_9ORYZ|nr:hypothetical protein E2562_036306 [Oryza meyeriana var. granulata]